MTDELTDIKARWFTEEMHHPNYWADLASRDIPWLVNEVERLREERDFLLEHPHG